MKKKYILAFFTFIAFTSVIISCSDDDEYVPVEDKLPVATDDSASYALLSNVNINVTSNDTSGDQVVITSVNLVGGIDTDGNGTLDNLIVLGEGTWVVNSVTGVITFTPISTFLGNPTPIKYYVKDTQGNNSNQATITVVATSTVNANLDQVPYPKLSDYGFFAGEMKNQIPSLNVLPYTLATPLFTDYAHKKRFVWMPEGSKATYNGDGEIFEFPVGSVIIKTFYYENVLPSNTKKNVETRLLIKKTSGWIFADYVWNDNDTEATIQNSGQNKSITFSENGATKTSNYRFPSDAECKVCHKIVQGSEEIIIPIGPKPQNINFEYSYASGSMNQIQKWIAAGYLQGGFSLPTEQNTTVDYTDTSKPLDVRVRSYLDINCAHCHKNGAHCSYRAMRFAFNETTNPINLGVCLSTEDLTPNPAMTKIVNPGNINRSMMNYRLNSTDNGVMMPLSGRSLVHEEALLMIQEWINSLQPCN